FLYKQVFTSATISSNGNLQYGSTNGSLGNTCLPDPNFSSTIFPHWDDLRTDAGTDCSTYGSSGCGVFTVIQGTSPNRKFVIEWRSVLFSGQTAVHFELILYENLDRFDMAYATISGNGGSATAGVQKDPTSGLFTQYSCNTPSLIANLYLIATAGPCN